MSNNKDLGTFCLTLENNSLHDKICGMLDNFIKYNADRHIVIFNQLCEKIDTGSVPLLPVSYSKYFHGNILTFDIASLLIAVECVNVQSVFFYAQNTPWTNSYNNYEDWQYLFGNKKLKIIANNQDTYNIYNMIWNNSIGICEEINYEKFKQFV
jgi:hypothetical protein